MGWSSTWYIQGTHKAVDKELRDYIKVCLHKQAQLTTDWKLHKIVIEMDGKETPISIWAKRTADNEILFHPAFFLDSESA